MMGCKNLTFCLLCVICHICQWKC